MSPTSDILYKLRGKIKDPKLGAHRSSNLGALGSFRDIVPFYSYPEARRIDLKASIQNPFEDIFVRRFERQAAVDVYAIVDLSRSVSFAGQSSKPQLIKELCISLAGSVQRIGDRFGLIACGTEIDDASIIPASKYRSIKVDVADRLQGMHFESANADGLLNVAERLAGKRKLIFLISDFLFPESFLQQLFDSLHGHDVVPVLLKESEEDLGLPDFGFMRVRDLETNEARVVFMRPALKRAWVQRVEDHDRRVGGIANSHGRSLVVLRDAFDPERFSQAIWES